MDSVTMPWTSSKQIIVCKYKEDISWLNEFKHIPTVIYDKRNRSSPYHLPNIPSFPIHKFGGIRHHKTPTGRESLAYLYHIIKYYDHLADINIFLQGNPRQNDSDVRETLRTLDSTKDYEINGFLPLNFPIVICDRKGAPLHRGLPIERIFHRLFRNECPSLFAYSWGAMFCVTRTAILRHPLSFYEEMMQIIFEEPLAGYVYERLWPSVLGSQIYFSKEDYPQKKRYEWQLPDLV